MAEVWWRRQPQRVLAEDKRLQQLVAEGVISHFAWKKQADDQLWLTAELLLGSALQEVELRLPSRYPGECPSLRPIPYGKPLSSHQFGGDGVLCLELGPDNWHSRFAAADLLVSAHKLLLLEQLNTKVSTPIPSRHRQTPGMTVRGQTHRLIVTPELINALQPLDAALRPFEYVWFLEDAALVYWVVRVHPDSEFGALPPRIATAYRQTGHAVRVAASAASPPSGATEFRDFLGQNGAQGSVESLTGLVLLLRGDEILARRISQDPADSVRNLVTIQSQSQDQGRIGSILGATSGASVAVVGAGSIGSKVANSLARSGVKDFLVIDGDLFLPENVLRHDADFTHVGLLKVEAVAARIRDVATNAVKTLEVDHELADATNPMVHSLTTDSLSKTTVLVDATANPDVFNFLADLASVERRPLVWAEVFAGGLGGYVAYAVPTITPCPSCVRSAFLAYLEGWPPAPRFRAHRYDAESEEGPLIATDADVSFIASALTSTVLRILTGDLDGCSPLLVVGLRRGWVFERAFETKSLSVRKDDFWCENCWTGFSEPDTEKLAVVERLLT